MKAVGIRELKNRLSRFIDEVKHGEVILVTDRGRVVAELRQPSGEGPELTPLERRLLPFVEDGTVSRVCERDPEAYGTPRHAMDAEAIDSALGASRGER